MNCLDNSYEEAQSNYKGFASETPEPASVSAEASGVKTPKQNSLRETLMMFRKNTHKETPPVVARAAACIEAEHIQNTKYMQKEEERKEKQIEKNKSCQWSF
ncbi:hypothetical protein AVEN_201288-1 [Araneus ventricosus]|uniref:Uncharacterized protein n=1 Tax=Araneus ventricosus TaxID=182803 RepID=A0A4Y2EE26_ARAVE|nr:hypothetical protein AVEN_133651-1 [Araneus ventricosus]GBM27392.1 hypothetical protein AVEN_201288-1 [Araneus ventricosus]